MPYYRLYHVRNGRFARAENLHAADDEAALASARLLLREDVAELWCGSRKIAILEPREAPQ